MAFSCKFISSFSCRSSFTSSTGEACPYNLFLRETLDWTGGWLSFGMESAGLMVSVDSSPRPCFDVSHPLLVRVNRLWRRVSPRRTAPLMVGNAHSILRLLIVHPTVPPPLPPPPPPSLLSSLQSATLPPWLKWATAMYRPSVPLQILTLPLALRCRRPGHMIGAHFLQPVPQGLKPHVPSR